MTEAWVARRPQSTRSVGKPLAVLLVVSGVLVVGYAPFLHAYNAVYYGAVVACRSIGMAWLSTPFTLAVPLLGFALVALGTSFLQASRTALGTEWGIDTERLAEGLELPLRLLTAIALVSGIGYAMSSEVYDRVPLEGVWFARPRLGDWVTVALPAVTALLLGRIEVRGHVATSAGGGWLRAARRPSRWPGIMALAGWTLPVAAIARGGWDIHFDVPPGFVLVLEFALGVALVAAWRSGAPDAVLVRLARMCVVAELARVCVGDSATSLIHSRALDFTFYERHLFTAGRFVNGNVAMVWIAVLAGCCGALLWTSRRPRSEGEARGVRGGGQERSFAARSAERATRWFLLLSVLWFVVSMTGLDLVRSHDRIFGECALAEASGAGRRVEAMVGGAQLLAGWVFAMGAAHLMASAAIELAAVLRGVETTRARSDRRAWRTMLGAGLVLCLVSWARLAWFAVHR